TECTALWSKECCAGPKSPRQYSPRSRNQSCSPTIMWTGALMVFRICRPRSSSSFRPSCARSPPKRTKSGCGSRALTSSTAFKAARTKRSFRLAGVEVGVGDVGEGEGRPVALRRAGHLDQLEAVRRDQPLRHREPGREP